jgi:hypothetical protein
LSEAQRTVSADDLARSGALRLTPGMRHVPQYGSRSARALVSLIPYAFAVLSISLAGCSSDGTPASNSGGTGGGANSDAIQLTQEENYTFTSSLSMIPSYPLAEKSDINVCWGNITVDMQGHTVDPTKDINDVSLIQVNSSDQATVAGWLNAGTLGSSKVVLDHEYKPKAGETCANLSQFNVVGQTTLMNPTTDFIAKSDVSYLMVFATGTQIGFGARTILFVEPTSGASMSEIQATGDSHSFLTFNAVLAANTVPVPLNKPTQIVDWTAVKTDGQGAAIGKNDISSILVGFYQGKMPADLQTGFLNLEQLPPATGGATMSWEIKVPSGTTASLGNGTGRNGEPAFPGFTNDQAGTWILGMFCDTCQNPAPRIVTVLAPQ